MKKFLMVMLGLFFWEQNVKAVDCTAHVEEYVAFQVKKVKHGRGHIPPAKDISAARHMRSNVVYGDYVKSLPKATQPSYDLRTAGLVPKVLNQGGCGDCYMFSGTRVMAGAFLKSGAITLTFNPNFNFSPQYGLDCHPELGGCNGGDEWQVTQIGLANGWYTTDQYPGAGQNPVRCQSITTAPLKITAMIYCDPNAGANSVASTQSIKNAILANGLVSIAIAAGSADWDNIGPDGILNGPNTGDTSIDHAITYDGWADNGSPLAVSLNLPNVSSGGYWVAQNQWDTDWGANGFAYIPYGAYSGGTEAYFCTAGSTPIPVTPPVTPPTPGPGPTPVTPCFHPLRPWLCNGVNSQMPTIGVTNSRRHIFPIFRKGRQSGCQ